MKRSSKPALKYKLSVQESEDKEKFLQLVPKVLKGIQTCFKLFEMEYCVRKWAYI